MKLKKNDNVMMISGKDRGKSGKILSIFLEENKVAVAGLNLIKKHVRKSSKFPKGGRIELPAKIDASNVMIICPSCKKLTRPKIQIDKSGKERICRNCNKPLLAKEEAK